MSGEKNLYFESIPLRNSKNYHNFKFLADVFEKVNSLSKGSHLFLPKR